MRRPRSILLTFGSRKKWSPLVLFMDIRLESALNRPIYFRYIDRINAKPVLWNENDFGSISYLFISFIMDDE